MTDTIYQFSVQTAAGQLKSLSDFRDQVVLIVNTASECGYAPQLADLEALRKEFSGEPFHILAFPSNDFGGQEPLDGPDVVKFCEVNYQAGYSVMSRVHVRGANAHPLFRFLADRRQNGRMSVKPRWNFYKWLIDKNGTLHDFFFTFTRPNATRVKRKIRALLAQ